MSSLTTSSDDEIGWRRCLIACLGADYGLGGDLSQIKNGSHVFKCRIEGDTWYHVGKLAAGTTIDEQWTRVKPAEAAAATTAAEKQPAAAKQP